MDYTKKPGKEIKTIGNIINKEKPVISIVTPFYNGGKTLMETANCIFSQTYPFFEWIIVDDGSKDQDSLKELAKLEKMDPRIKVFHKENGGPSMARDLGISKASKDTKYVYFLDCDDLIDHTMLECLYWTLETHEDASFAYTTMVNFGASEFIWEKYLTIEQQKEENLICISSMVRKEDLLEVGCFGIKEKAMYEDWNLWLKLIRAGKKPLRVSAPLFWYRTSDSGELSRAKKNNENAMRYVRETASEIADDQVEVIQFPRYGDDYAITKKLDMILPDYEKDKRKTVLFLFPWMVVGGADFFNLELIKRLPKDQYRSIILTTTPSNNPIRQDFEDYAEVYDMASFLDRIDYQAFADYIISSRKVDLVFISNTEYGYYMTPYLKGKYPNVPFIDYIHSVDLRDERGSFARASRDVNDYLYGTYVCNGFTQRQLKELFNKESDIVYIGTMEKKFDPEKYNKEELLEKYDLPKDKKIISFIARLATEKRPEMFVEIAKRINMKESDTFFVMAGDGPLMDEVKSKINNNFKLLGMVSETEEIYAISDITINCSSLEGLALTSYESLAMGVPVISTDVGGQPELIDDSVGGIIHYNSDPTSEVYDQEINEYVDKTIKVLKDLDKIKKNCRQKILDGFTLDIMANKMKKIFMTAIESAKNDKVPAVNENIYELACEVYTDYYFKCTNAYYENNLGVWLTAKKVRFPRLYRHLGNRLKAYGAYKEGKNIIEWCRRIKKVLKHFFISIKLFVIAVPSMLILLLKIILYYIKRPFKKN